MSPVFTAYLLLAGAVVCETLGMSMLQASQQFTRPVPTLVMAVSFLATGYLMSTALRTLPLGIAYAIWAGSGIVLLAAISVVVFKQALDTAAVLGIGLIISGVVVVNLFSKAAKH